jgi:hypothetical protein
MSLITLDQKDFAEMPTISTVAADRAYNILKITKDTYGSVVKECALNSNVPEWLIYTFMFCASGCKNLVRNQTNFNASYGYQRIGLFQATEVEVVRQMYLELKEQRLTQAELDYLRSLNSTWKSCLGNSSSLTDVFQNVDLAWKGNDWTSPNGGNTWFGRGTVTSASNVEEKYFDQLSLNDSKVSIAYAAIRLGKLWDTYASLNKETLKKVLLSKEDKVVDKVILDMLTPTKRVVGDYWTWSQMNKGAVFQSFQNSTLTAYGNMYNFLLKDNFSKIPIPKGTGSIGISDSDAVAALDSKYAPISANTNDLATADNIIPFNNLYTWLVTCCGQNGVIQIANSL